MQYQHKQQDSTEEEYEPEESRAYYDMPLSQASSIQIATKKRLA